MKGCFVLQRRYAHIGHEIAKELISSGAISEACGFVQVRSNMEFLQKQGDVKYSALLLDEDIHRAHQSEKVDLAYLRDLEERIGIPTLWQYIDADRIIRFGQFVREYPHNTTSYTYEQMLQLAQVYSKRIGAFLDAEKPDFVLMTPPGSLGTLLLYHMARQRGIRTLVIVFPGLRDCTCVTDDFERLTGAERILAKKEEKPFLEFAKKEIEAFRNAPRPYSKAYDPKYVKYTRARQLDFLTPQGALRSLHWFTEVVRLWAKAGESKKDYSTIKPWHYYIDLVKRKARNLIGIEDLYDRFDTDVPYAYFPLHLEPELALLTQAPFSSNQMEVISHIAQSLPVGMLLYVKEHPHMIGFRPRSYYRELKKIPNLRLLLPTIPGVEVMRTSQLIFTIAGTTGFEALLFNKRVISFGNMYFNAISSVSRSRVPEELPQLVKEQLGERSFNEEEVARFVAAIYADCARIDFGHIWAHEYDPEKLRVAVQKLAEVVARKIKEVA